MTNSYSTCTYNSLDLVNPFSSCNTTPTSQTTRNNTISTMLSTNDTNSSNLYSNEQNYLKSGAAINVPSNFDTTDNWDYNAGSKYLVTSANDVQTKRGQIDSKLSQIKSPKNMDNNDDSTILYNASFYVNLLWVILATSLIYFIFTEL